MGFHMNEAMVGQHEFEPGFGPPGKRPMAFRARWGTDSLLGWANPFGDEFMVNEMKGTVTIDGLCADVPMEGTLALRYIQDQTLRYSFEFEVDGVEYRFVGEKVWLRPWNLPWSHTTCFGRLVRKEDNTLISTSLTHFRLRSALGFLASFRPV